MSNTPNATASASVAFPIGTIAVVFLWVAKVQNLWGLGDISWWLVFAPYWLPFLVFLAIVLIILVVGAVGVGIAELIDKRKKSKRIKELDKQLANGTITQYEYDRRKRLWR